jgi:hypothetical protein
MSSRVRGASIAVALLVYGFQAAPLPRNVKKSQFESEVGREEMDRWVELFGAVGVRLTRDELSERSFAVSKAISDVRKEALKPFQPWFRLTGTGQGWGLFTYPDTYPHQLRVEIFRDGKWELVYAGLDEEHAWRREQLAFRRVRGVYDSNSTKPGATWDTFADWVAKEALADFPDASRVRVGFVRVHTHAPGEAVPEDADPERRHFRERSRT